MPDPDCPLAPQSGLGRFLFALAVAVLATVALLAWSPAWADDAEARKAEGPYFQVASDDPSLDRLPLKSTHVEVRITGVIADVVVTQRYRNEGQRAIEARYVFPGSTGSAVHALHVRLGDRLLTARIREKQQARVEYETAKQEGRTTALLEQHRPNVFEMNVANILPGDDVAVELRYTELLTPTDAVYGFVFPTVVGPRYHAPRGPAAAERWPATPYLRAGVASEAAFSIQVVVDAPVPIQALTSSSHAVRITGLGTSVAHVGGPSRRATVTLQPGVAGNDRDFVLQYQLAGDRVATGLMLFQSPDAGGENFFLAMVEPPKQVPIAQVSPRDYVFVVDISGSMHGYPLETSKALLEKLIGSLRPSDTFNVMLFAGSNRMLAPASVPATRANIDQALQTIRAMGGSGSTEIVPALRRIAALPKAPDVSRSVVVVTDGYVTVENEVFQLVRQNLGRFNVFAFGIGSSVNRHLIKGLARAGQGEAFVVTRPEQATAQAERLRRMIDSPVLTQVKAQFEGLDTYDTLPAQLPDLLAGRPLVLYGKFRGPPRPGARVVVEGRSAEGAWRGEAAVDGRDDAGPAALRHLWARQRIAMLADQEALEGGSAQKDAITALGLRYGLLTAYTSFVAVDQVVRNPNPALAASVQQPLPLPAGVSELAVGAEVPGTPEASGWVALLLTLAIVGVATRTVRRRGC